MNYRTLTLVASTAILVILSVVFRAAAMLLARSPAHARAAIVATHSPQSSTTSPRELSLEDRADIFMARKDYDEAAAFYYRVLQEGNFKSARVWNKLGIAYQQQLKFRDASKAYESAGHLDMKFAEAWNNLGTVSFMENRFRKSVKYYKRAIELRSDDAAFHLNLGTSYQHLKKYRQAEEEFSTALDIDPNVLTQQSSLGSVIRARGTDFQFYYYMAKAFASKGRAEEAVRYLRHAFEDGYKEDKKRIDEDPDFQKISHYPAYVELMKNPPVSIKD
jgi:tetratricopeptide (TPR) repeat protein